MHQLKRFAVLTFVGLAACSLGGSHGSRPRADDEPDLVSTPIGDLAATGNTVDGAADLASPNASDLASPDLGGASDLQAPSPDLVGTNLAPPVITSLTVNAFDLWNGESLVVTATLTLTAPLHAITLTDLAGHSYGTLSQIGSNQFQRTLSWAQIHAAGGLTFSGSATRTFVVTATDVNGLAAEGRGDISFHCDSGVCQSGVCTAATAKLGACTTTIDQATTCTEICGRTNQTCRSLGCGGYSGVLVAPDCSGSESGLTSTLDGSKMTCDSFFFAIATLGLGGIRCCCD